MTGFGGTSGEAGEHYRKAQKLVTEGNIPEAFAEIQAALEGGITSADAHYLYAQLLITTGEYEKAIPVLEKVVSLMPWHTHAFNDLAVIAFKREDFDKAVGYYKEALSADNGNYTAVRNLLNLLKGLDKLDEAEAITQELIENDPGDEKLRTIVAEYGFASDGVRRNARSHEPGHKASKEALHLLVGEESGDVWEDLNDVLDMPHQDQTVT